MYSGVVEQCEHVYSPLDLRGSQIGEESDSDVNVESDDEIVQVTTTQSGRAHYFFITEIFPYN